MLDHATIQAERDALAAHAEETKAQYAQLEQMLDDLRRAIDMDMGGLRALDALLARLGAPCTEHENAPTDVGALL